MVIDVMIDGIYCRECSELHPTLYWHDKYNDYLLNIRDEWEKGEEKHPVLFGDAEYDDSLSYKGLKEEETQGACMVCGTMMYFKSLMTDKYVCSDECKYALEEVSEGASRDLELR